MEPIITSIVTALVAGAIAKSSQVASQAVQDAYDGLKNLIIQKLGYSGAVQSVEDDPRSESAHAALIEQMVKQQLDVDVQLQQMAECVEQTLQAAQCRDEPTVGNIDIASVRGRLNATVQRLVASGSIRLNSVVAETGDAMVSDLFAGQAPDSETPHSKNG